MKGFWPFYVIVVSIFIAVTGVNLLSDGMFFDGVFYANFSKVMASDSEGFWVLRHCLDCEKLFGHPPLGIFLESLWFKIFGNSIYVERVYSFSTYIISGFLIHLIFKKINPEKPEYSFVTIFFWIITPLITWGASNNMLENSLTIFVLGSVFFLLKSLNNKNNFFIFLAGLMIFFAFLTKGFIGTFPLVFFALYWFVFKKISFVDMMLKSAILILSFLGPLILIFIFSENGAFYLTNYFSLQVVNSIQNETTVSSRFFILAKLFNEVLPSVIILFVYFIFNKNRFVKADTRWAIFFLILGLFGVVPIMVSLKQSSFYIISALPFFSISFSLFVINFFKLDLSKLKKIKWLKPISFLLLIFSLVIMFSQVGKIGRDQKMIEDVYSIVNYSNDEVISIPHELYWHWALKAYFLRYGNISLSSNHSKLNEYFLIEKSKNDDNLWKYDLVKDIELKNYNLYQKKK